MNPSGLCGKSAKVEQPTSLQERLSSAHRTLYDSLQRLESLADKLCGPVPSDGEAAASVSDHLSVFGAVEQSASHIETAAKDIHNLCDRIAKCAGI